MRPISEDLREKIVIAFSQSDTTYRALSERFSVSYAACYQIIKRYRKTGSVRALPFNKGHRAKLGNKERAWLRDLVTCSPDLTLRELSDQINREFDLSVHTSAIHRTLCILGFSRKKKPRSK